MHNSFYALIAIFFLGLVKLNFAATALVTLSWVDDFDTLARSRNTEKKSTDCILYI